MISDSLDLIQDSDHAIDCVDHKKLREVFISRLLHAEEFELGRGTSQRNYRI